MGVVVFVLDETAGERNQRRERHISEEERIENNAFNDDIYARINKLRQSDDDDDADDSDESRDSPVEGEARDFIAKPKPVSPGIAGGQPETTPVRRTAVKPLYTAPGSTSRNRRETFEQKERVELQKQMAQQARELEEEERRNAQAERLKVTPRISPNDGEIQRRREWFGAFEDSVRQDSPRRSDRLREKRVAEIEAEVDSNLQNPYGTAAAANKLQISMPVIKMVGVKLTDDKNRLMDLNGLNWQLSIQIDFVPRLQTLQGITRSQRRDGEQIFKESQMRLQQTKIKKKSDPKKKV